MPWGIDLGVNEAVIYGERGLDIAYLNPFMFFWSAQHHWGDRDNETMGADIEIHALDGLSLYGALFVEELYLRGFFDGDSRNKISFQLGTFIVDPLSFQNFDVLITPTTAITAFELGITAPKTIEGKGVSPTGWQPFTFPFKFTGHPAASIPCGFDDEGLPIGIQIVGHLHDELKVLQVSKAFEDLAPWQNKKPNFK